MTTNAKRIFVVTDFKGEINRITADRVQAQDGYIAFFNGSGPGSVEVAGFCGWISFIEVQETK